MDYVADASLELTPARGAQDLALIRLYERTATHHSFRDLVQIDIPLVLDGVDSPEPGQELLQRSTLRMLAKGNDSMAKK